MQNRALANGKPLGYGERDFLSELQATPGHCQLFFARNSGSNVFDGGPMDAGPVNDGLWHHAAMAIDASGGRLYLDGVLKSSLPWTGAAGPVTTTEPLYLAIYQGNSFWSGQLDEVSVWNTNLSTAQIQAAMSKSLAGTEPGLIGCWRLDEGSGGFTADATTNGNTGTLSGSPAWISSGAAILNPDPGYAVSMNGSNAYAQAPSGIWFSNAFTVEGWVYARSYNSWSRLFDFGNAGYLQEVYLALTGGTGGYPTMGIFTNGNTTLLGSTNQLPLNQWAHLAATFDGTNGAIYINGILSGFGALPVSPGSFLRTNNYFGRSLFAGDGYANAVFDEVRIWNVARTQAQLQAQMGRSLSGHELGLVGYWRFDEGSGMVSADATGAGNAVTLMNGPTWQLSQFPVSPSLPEVTTFAASPIEPNAATLNGTINPNGSSTTAWFDYGTTANYGSRLTLTNVLSVASPVSVNVSGLASGTLYHFRAGATNSAGANYGLDQTFTTALGTNANLSALALSLGTLSPAFASNILSYTTSLTNGGAGVVTVTAAAADNTATLQYSVDGSAFSNLTSDAASPALPLLVGSNTVEIQVTSGDASRVQLYSVAVNRFLLPPNVTTLPASGYSSNAATLNGTVNPNTSPTYGWFQWGTTVSYGNFSPTQYIGSAGITNMSQGLSGLASGVTYHFRAVATNAGGQVAGLDQTFHPSGSFVVTNYGDSGSGTLRALVASSVPGDVLLLTNVGTLISLLATSGPIVITNDISLVGPATSLATISGNYGTRVFLVTTGASVYMSGLSIVEGLAPAGATGTNGAQGSSGYYYDCGFGDCYQCPGAGLEGGMGSAGGGGGGIYNQGTLQMTGCLIADNVGGTGGTGGAGGPPGTGPGGSCGAQTGPGGVGGVGGSGGGIYSVGTLMMYDCSIIANQAGSPGAQGSGGINTSPTYTGAGAGLAIYGVAALTNCTIAQNQATNNTGGGIFVGYTVPPTTVTLVACTITDNEGMLGAAGIYNLYDEPVSLRNTIVADNFGFENYHTNDLSGIFTSGGHNLISRADGSSGMNGPGDIVGTLAYPWSAVLSPLETYYGTTPTCPPEGEGISPAVDTGDDALMSPPFNLLQDQTGRFRQYGYHVDIGAAEYIYPCYLETPFVATVTGTNALVGVDLDSGGTPSGVYAQYGLNTSYGGFTAVSPQALGQVGLRGVYPLMTNLLPGTLYHYRIVMTNYTYTFTTPDETLTTLSSNAALTALTLSSGTLAPAFASGTLNYTATAAPQVSSVNVTATPAQSGAVLSDRINGGSYTVISSGAAGNALPLRVGSNSVDVLVTAPDHTTTADYNIALAWNPPIPPPTLTNPLLLTNGSFQFTFTNLPGAPFTVWASGNLLLPLAGWSSLGPVTDNPAGFFQFTDPAGSTNSQRFYQLRSP